jgi:CheY-like chemotaxis protein
MSTHSHTILVVEDDDELRGVLLELLELEGFGAAQARNGREALDYLRTHERPCLIVLDLMMPVMSGPEFRAEQMRDGELADVPVVVVSASHDVRREAQALGAVAAFAKPLPFEAFFDTLREKC